jgi:hypothetical protein
MAAALARRNLIGCIDGLMSWFFIAEPYQQNLFAFLLVQNPLAFAL